MQTLSNFQTEPRSYSILVAQNLYVHLKHSIIFSIYITNVKI